MASASELEDLEKALVGWKAGVPPAETLTRYLRLVRELRVRDSDLVARFGTLLLRHHKGSLSEEELWLVHEQVAIAMLDSGAVTLAVPLINAVTARFAGSSRSKRLQGMYLEASGSVERAAAHYEQALLETSTDEIMLKRMVAIEKTRGNTQAALDLLRKYVDVFSGDVLAWEEMAELYLQLLMYKQALFCYEELLLFSPASVHFLVRYADILYTMGGSNNCRMARSYYAKAVEISSGRSVRALFGILSCYANINEKVTLQDARTRAQIELPDLTAQAVIKLYRQYAPDKLPLLEPMLKQQGLLE